MKRLPESPYRVSYDGTFDLAEAPTRPPRGRRSGREARRMLDHSVEELHDLQRRLYADDRWAVLLIFQAMDAAGKDSTIRAVMTGINPAGCQVFAFKRPSERELDHDFLWRSAQRTPERGRIGIFNRSYYEEVLVVRVHPGILDAQRLPERAPLDRLWQERYASIREHEAHLARNGTVILKFWLNVSREEQHRRFLDRLEEPSKRWKFDPRDLEESARWDDYMAAYEEALRETSRSWAPWYAIPADDKPFMRATVAGIVVDALRGLDLEYPSVDPADEARYRAIRDELRAELDERS